MNNIISHWSDNLITWAIENNIPEPQLDEIYESGLDPHRYFLSHGGGLPRNKHDLENNMLVLRLENGNVKNLPSSIGCLTKLHKIFLSGNKLTKLPNELCDLEDIKILDISNNDILELPTNIVNLKNLHLFIFNGNENLKFTDIQKEWIKPFQSKGYHGQ